MSKLSCLWNILTVFITVSNVLTSLKSKRSSLAILHFITTFAFMSLFSSLMMRRIKMKEDGKDCSTAFVDEIVNVSSNSYQSHSFPSKDGKILFTPFDIFFVKSWIIF